jgi:hypothetical protein
MPISSDIVAAFAPFGNAILAFEVPNGVLRTDPKTGNQLADTEIIEYLVAFKIDRPNYTPESGIDNTTYNCTGRLLYPSKLDSRIANGSQADAIINKQVGRFELVFDLSTDYFHAATVKRIIQGTFRITG